MPKFSERAGAAPSVSIQLDSMNEPLRHSLWNFTLQIIEGKELDATVEIGVHILKHPRHLIPYSFTNESKSWLWTKYKDLQWYQVYDLLEFVVENCSWLSSCRENVRAAQVSANRVLAEELSGYRFVQGVLSSVTDKSEIAAIEQAAVQSNAVGLQGVRTHLESALELLGRKPQPDYRNSIKESISAVEATVKKISGEHGGGLDAALKELAKHVEIHKGLQAGFLSLYGYTSGKGGIRHAILEETNIGFDEAKFMLVACSAFVNFLIVKAGAGGLLLGQK